MTQITQIIDRSQEDQIRKLESEYFNWVNNRLNSEFQITLDIEKMITKDMNDMNIYFPPDGGMFLAEVDQLFIGTIFLTKLRQGVGQIRRMYVRDEYRRRGIARKLFETAIESARNIGYSQLLLESPKSWGAAHALYHDLGFNIVQMYPESEVPEHLREYWVFIQLNLE
ncbi:GNAT family N-acetyltransferase [Deinococcus sp.]|uniref:GNAT family N-acetyltransferase n=1 Tax=Deinococcus sp. TaxID=47478 RepID=UPI0025D03F44|nr:GNAT family N-acetyltransferase [Deinococcus sp.]